MQKETSFVTYVAVAFFIAGFPFFAIGSEPALSTFEGTVTQKEPCVNINGFLITASGGTQFIYQKNFSQSVNGNTPPVTGKPVSAILLPTVIECKVFAGNRIQTFSKQLILYYTSGTTNSVEQTQSTGASSQKSSGNSNSVSSLVSTLPSILTSLFGKGAVGSLSSSGVTGALGGAVSAATGVGGGGLGIPFGGVVVSPPIPCTAPPGAYMVILGPPNPGKYMYIPVVTHSYLYGPPVIPGQWVLGKAVPAVCVIGTITTPVMLIMSHGSSLL